VLSGTAQSEHTRRHTFAVPGRRQGLCRAAWAPGWLLGAPPRLAPALGSPCSPAAAPALGWKRPNPATACPEDLGSVAVAAVAGPAHAHPHVSSRASAGRGAWPVLNPAGLRPGAPLQDEELPALHELLGRLALLNCAPPGAGGSLASRWRMPVDRLTKEYRRRGAAVQDTPLLHTLVHSTARATQRLRHESRIRHGCTRGGWDSRAAAFCSLTDRVPPLPRVLRTRRWSRHRGPARPRCALRTKTSPPPGCPQCPTARPACAARPASARAPHWAPHRG